MLYVVSVFSPGGKKVLVYIRMYYFRVQYSCGGVLVFRLQWEIVFSVLHILSVQYSCAVCPFISSTSIKTNTNPLH